jgi:hypothetical protein
MNSMAIYIYMSLYSAYVEALLELRTRQLLGWTCGLVVHEGSMRMQGTVSYRKQVNYDFRILKQINCSKKTYIMRI